MLGNHRNSKKSPSCPRTELILPGRARGWQQEAGSWMRFPNGVGTQSSDTQTIHVSKKSPTGPTERTPKPQYLIDLATSLGVRWQGPIQFLMECMVYIYLHLVDFYGSMYVGKYTNPMDGIKIFSHQIDIPKAFRSGEFTQSYTYEVQIGYMTMSCSLSSVFLVWLVACCRCFLTHVVLRVELNLFVYEALLTSIIPIPSK